MNWGKTIVISLSTFIIFIAGMSIYMLASPQDDYDQDYYEKGLSFDKDYAREENVVKYHAQPQIQLSSYAVEVAFTGKATGTIKFERPSDNQMDKIYQVNALKLTVPVTNLATGKWQVIVDWKSNGRPYLYQHEITIK